jgi:kynurenine formamidase
LAFGVPYNNSGTPTTREALRLKWNGRLVLNKTTVTNTHDALTVTHPAGSNAVVSLTVDANNHTGTHANALIYTKSKNTYWAGYAFQSSHGYIGSLLGKRDSDGTTDQEIRMEIGGDGPNDNEEKTWTFRNSGNLALSAGNIEFASGYGIDFSADGNAGGMTSELLHDYEEGTWTMVMTNLGDHTKHGDSRGGYTRVGNKVTAYFFYKWTGRSTTNGAYSVSLDLPFTSMDVKGVGHGSLGLESIRASTSTRTSYHSSVTQNQAKILFRASGDNVGEVSLDGSISTSASAGYLFGMVCYQVA